MSSDFGIGELHSEFTKKCHQCGLLFFRARVLRVFAVGGQTTDIADAYGMGVVPLAVRSHLCERSAMMHRAVAVDDEVISDGGKASLPCQRSISAVEKSLPSGVAEQWMMMRSILRILLLLPFQLVVEVRA